MNQKYIPDDQTLKIILAEYNIADFTYKYNSNQGDATTIFVFANNQNYVLRVSANEPKAETQVQAEVDFIHFLNENNFPTFEIYSNIHEKFLSKIAIDEATWLVILMEKIYGQEIPKNDWIKDIDLLGNMAQTQATLHHLGTEFAQINLQNDYDTRVCSSHTGQLLIKKLEEFNTLNDASNDLSDIVSDIKSLEFQYSAFLPLGFIHDDFCWKNLLFTEEGDINVINFAGLRVGPIASCLGSGLFTVVLSAFEAGQDIQTPTQEYLDLYREVREIEQIELGELLKPLILRLDLAIISEILDSKRVTSKIENYVLLKKQLLKLNFS